MFEDSDTKLFEGVWEIKGVSPLGDGRVLVEFTTGWYKSLKAMKDPSENPWEMGPCGQSVQSVAVPVKDVPEIDEFNDCDRHWACQEPTPKAVGFRAASV